MPDPIDIMRIARSEANRGNANTRLAFMSDDEVQAMTAAARAVKAERHFERLKDAIAPAGTMAEAERERRARNLLEAQRARAKAAKLRAEARRRQVEAVLDSIEAEAS